MGVAPQSDGGCGTASWAVPPVEIRLLGGFELLVAGHRAAVKLPCQRLLAFLALTGRRLRREYVAGTLWPDASEARAAGSLRSALWSLRGLEARVVLTESPLLWLAERAVVDVRSQIALARELSRSNPSVDLIGRGLFEKELLPDWYDDWIGEPREHWRQIRLHALEAATLQLSTLGRHAEAIEHGLTAVRIEPLRESAHRALMQSHLAEGNIGEASRQYQMLRRALLAELDIEPSTSLRQLLDRAKMQRRSQRLTPAGRANRPQGSLPDHQGGMAAQRE